MAVQTGPHDAQDSDDEQGGRDDTGPDEGKGGDRWAGAGYPPDILLTIVFRRCIIDISALYLDAVI